MPTEESTAQPAEAPAATSDEDGAFCVAIPAPRRWRLVALLLLLAIWWGVATARAFVRFFTPLQPGQDPHWFSVPGLALWLLGLLVLDALLYMLSGREVVSIDDTLLTVTCEAPFYILTRRFDITHVGGLRVTPVVSADRLLIGHWVVARAVTLLGFTGSRLVFDYDFLHHHFGAGLEEAAATQLLTDITQRFPALAASHPYGAF